MDFVHFDISLNPGQSDQGRRMIKKISIVIVPVIFLGACTGNMVNGPVSSNSNVTSGSVTANTNAQVPITTGTGAASTGAQGAPQPQGTAQTAEKKPATTN